MNAAYDLYAPAMFGLVLKLVPDKNAATTILQQTFIEHSKLHTDCHPLFIDLVRIMMKNVRDSAVYSEEELKAKAKEIFIPRDRFSPAVASD